MKQILQELGINLSYLTAGFLGGVVKAFVMGDGSPWAVVASVITGMITANYLTDLLIEQLGTKPGATGFFVGLTAMILCQGMIAAAGRLHPFKGDGNDGGK